MQSLGKGACAIFCALTIVVSVLYPTVALACAACIWQLASDLALPDSGSLAANTATTATVESAEHCSTIVYDYHNHAVHSMRAKRFDVI